MAEYISRPSSFAESGKTYIKHLTDCRHDLDLLLTFLTKQPHPLSKYTIVKPYKMLKKLPTFYPETKKLAGYHLDPKDIVDPSNNFSCISSLWVKPSSIDVNPRILDRSFAVGFRLDDVAFKTGEQDVSLWNIHPKRGSSRMFELAGRKPAQYVTLVGIGTEDVDVVDVMINYVRGVRSLVSQSLDAEKKDIADRLAWAKHKHERRHAQEQRVQKENARIKAGPYSWEKLFKGNDLGTLFSD